MKTYAARVLVWNERNKGKVDNIRMVERAESPTQARRKMMEYLWKHELLVSRFLVLQQIKG